MSVMLESRRIKMSFNGFEALKGVDIDVYEGEIFGLLGPNGSGKSTWMDCVSGIIRPVSGSIRFLGNDVTGKSPDSLFRHGLSRSFQKLENFHELSVRENLLIGRQETHGSMLSRIFRFDESSDLRRARSLLASFGLGHVWNERIGALSYGQQKLCDLAMLLMSEPRMIMLDEPLAGVNPRLIEDICDHLSVLRQSGTTVVIIEHNMKAVLRLCDRVLVLDEGRTLAEGRPDEVSADPDVIDAYFGTVEP